MGTRLSKTQKPSNVQYKKLNMAGKWPFRVKRTTRLNVFVETNEICKASKLVNVHWKLMCKLLYKYFALRFSFIVSLFSDSSVDSSRRLRTITLEKVPGGINVEHRGFLLQRLIESRGSLQTSKTTLKDYGESKLWSILQLAVIS